MGKFMSIMSTETDCKQIVLLRNQASATWLWIFISRTNRVESMSGKFRLTQGENLGIFRVRYDLLPTYLQFEALPSLIRTFNATITIVHTDYDNFAILWTCRTLNSYGHTENSWLLTREPNATEEVMQAAYGYLDKFGMRNYFVKNRQDGCDLWDFF